MLHMNVLGTEQSFLSFHLEHSTQCTTPGTHGATPYVTVHLPGQACTLGHAGHSSGGSTA